MNLAAALFVGLRADSRIKMKLSGLNTDIKTILLTGIYDELLHIAWILQGSRNSRRPESVLKKLLHGEMDDEKTNENISYDSPEMYWSERRKIIGGG